MSSALAEAQGRCIDASPLHRWLGLRLERFDGTQVVTELPFRPEFVADPASGHLHGGVITAALDATAEMAVTARVGVAVPTVDLRVDFLRASAGEALRVEAHVEKLGRSLAVVDARALGADGATIALGRIVFYTAVAPVEVPSER